MFKLKFAYLKFFHLVLFRINRDPPVLQLRPGLLSLTSAWVIHQRKLITMVTFSCACSDLVFPFGQQTQRLHEVGADLSRAHNSPSGRRHPSALCGRKTKHFSKLSSGSGSFCIWATCLSVRGSWCHKAVQGRGTGPKQGVWFHHDSIPAGLKPRAAQKL